MQSKNSVLAYHASCISVSGCAPSKKDSATTLSQQLSRRFVLDSSLLVRLKRRQSSLPYCVPWFECTCMDYCGLRRLFSRDARMWYMCQMQISATIVKQSGNYECEECGYKVALAKDVSLPECENCEKPTNWLYLGLPEPEPEPTIVRPKPF